MKKMALFAAAALMSTAALAQKLNSAQVPQEVKTAFQKLYPAVSKVKWEKEKGNYEAEFEVNEIDHAVVLDAKGQVLETEEEITVNQLPSDVDAYVKSHYAGQSIKKADKITDSKGTVTYEAEIKHMDLIFDAHGKFIKEEKD